MTPGKSAVAAAAQGPFRKMLLQPNEPITPCQIGDAVLHHPRREGANAWAGITAAPKRWSEEKKKRRGRRGGRRASSCVPFVPLFIKEAVQRQQRPLGQHAQRTAEPCDSRRGFEFTSVSLRLSRGRLRGYCRCRCSPVGLFFAGWRQKA